MKQGHIFTYVELSRVPAPSTQAMLTKWQEASEDGCICLQQP